MSCQDTNPCSQPTPCTDQYNNCGCINPTTFGCTSYSGTALSHIDAVNGEDGDSILSKIDTEIGELQDSTGKVLIDNTDTCPEYLFDKLQEGLNISFSMTGTGCDKKLVINSTTGGVPVDVNAKVSATDSTTGYLNSKIDGGTHITKTILNPGSNEILRLNLILSTLLSTDSGNQLSLGTDGKLKTSYSAPDGSETKLIQGSGINISGSGTLLDPYVLSTNTSIQASRTCFDGIWRNLILSPTGNPNVTYLSGTPQFRYRFDGSIEFKGSITYTVAFGNYQSGNRKYTINISSLPLTCLNLTELSGTSDLKSINYIDIPQASADQIVQQYGYIIRKSTQNLIIEFQSAFTNSTTKTIVVNFEGSIIHPNI